MSAADLENERLIEQASLAEFFFEIRGQDELQRIYDETVVADQKEFELARAQYETGIADQISVVEAETSLQSAEAGATNIAVARAQYEHAIATLVGRTASGFSIPVKPMTTAPPPIPVGVPSELLERRPDIAAAERTMAQANAAIGIAYAAYFPNLTLSASGGFESSAFTKWLSVAKPLLVRGHIALGNYFRCWLTPRYRPTICRDLQRGCCRLSSDRAHCFPASGRWAC